MGRGGSGEWRGGGGEEQRRDVLYHLYLLNSLYLLYDIMVDKYDGNLHDFIANLRRVNGDPEPHDKYGPPVNLFAAGRKFWVTKTASAFG